MSEFYHRGEIAVQELTGARDEAILNGRVISTVIPPAARAFVGQQRTVAVGWCESSGDPWAALVVDAPGFATCDHGGTIVTLQTTGAGLASPAGRQALRETSAIGLLFIDLATRRRLRVNGLVQPSPAGSLRVLVEQAYANCPKYIQRRARVEADTVTPAETRTTGTGDPPDLPAWLSRTDTAFVASVGPEGRVDCSHRGGPRGFMRQAGEVVHVPDYPGNSMFCTLGNMTVDPRAGLVLVDFEARRQLHLTGHATLDLTPTGRSWTLRPRRWAISPLAGVDRWDLVDESPFNPPVAP